MKTLSTLVAVVFSSVVVAGCTMAPSTPTEEIIDENAAVIDTDFPAEEVVEELVPTEEVMPTDAVDPTTDDAMNDDTANPAQGVNDIPPVDMGDVQNN
jgi:hypothetical protein